MRPRPQHAGHPARLRRHAASVPLSQLLALLSSLMRARSAGISARPQALAASGERSSRCVQTRTCSGPGTWPDACVCGCLNAVRSRRHQVPRARRVSCCAHCKCDVSWSSVARRHSNPSPGPCTLIGVEASPCCRARTGPHSARLPGQRRGAPPGPWGLRAPRQTWQELRGASPRGPPRQRRLSLSSAAQLCAPAAVRRAQVKGGQQDEAEQPPACAGSHVRSSWTMRAHTCARVALPDHGVGCGRLQGALLRQEPLHSREGQVQRAQLGGPRACADLPTHRAAVKTGMCSWHWRV